MAFAVDTTFDVAFWFADTALNQNEYLAPQKMQRLLYLAQAYYAVAHRGKKLMPAIFVADEMGPIEPTIYRAFMKGRPDVEVDIFLPEQVEKFLDGIWKKFGHLSVERLNRLINDNNAYGLALRKGRRTEIPLDAMRSSFQSASNKKKKELPGSGKKIMVTQYGAPVSVQSWVPGTKPVDAD